VDFKGFYSLLMTGIHKRAGYIKRGQDKPVMISVLYETDQILEAKWRRTKEPILLKKTAAMGAWIIDNFCTGL
jgi:hypothetical protein